MNWIGAAMVVTASWLFGISLAKDEGAKLKALESLISLLSYMRRRMSGERIPLYEIFSEYEDGFLDSCGFTGIIRSHRNGITRLWSEAVMTLRLGDELEKEVVRFGNSLGEVSLDEQIRRLDALMLFLSEKHDGLSVTLPEKQKSIKTVCVLLGIMVSIILL